MALINVKESITGSFLTKTNKGYRGRRIFTVAFDGSDTWPTPLVSANSATGIPQINESWPNKPFVVVRSIDPRPKDNSEKLIEVTVDYESLTWTSGNDEENPFRQRPKRSWDFVITSEAKDQDIKGNPITNSSGELLDPPPQLDVYTPILRIERNERSFSASKAAYYIDTLNEYPFYGAGAKQARIVTFKGDEVYTDSYHYWRILYEIMFRPRLDHMPKPWQLRMLDQGYRVRTGEVDANSKPTYSDFDESGNRRSSPVLLDGAGNKLAENIRDLGNPTLAHWLLFDMRRVTDFRDLDLE